MSIKDYNARLENNNTNLNEILNTINNLPTLKLQDKSVAPTKEKQTIKADETYNGLGSVSVEAIPSSYVEPSGTLEITENGTYNVKNYESVTTDIKGSAEKYAPRIIKFENYIGTELDNEVANLDTSNITDMTEMFNSCKKIVELDLSHWNTSNVTNMYNMFNYCQKLKSINFSNWNTNNVTSMRGLIKSCAYITTLDLSGWYTSNLSITMEMFYGCSSLKTIDMRNFDFTKVTSYSNMFGSSASDGVPNDCEIIVKDDTAKSWITSKFSRLTNVKTIDEL